MAEQLQGGEQQKPFIDQYLERVGYADEPADQRILSAELSEPLEPYFEAHARWRTAVLDAADAEQQYVGLVGKSSDMKLPDHPTRSGVHAIHSGSTYEELPEKTGIGTEPSHYGRTKAGFAAHDAEQQLIVGAKAAAKKIQKSSSLPKESKAIWSTLLKEGARPALKQLVAYGLKAEALVGSARDIGDRATVMIRRRQPKDSIFYLGKGRQAEDHDFSDILVASSFDLHQVAEHGLELVLKDVRRLKFESYGMVSHGGTDGLIGSARFEDVWSKLEGAEVVEYPQIRVGAVTSRDQINASLEASFPILQNLVNPTSEQFWSIWELPNQRMRGFDIDDDNKGEKSEAAQSIFVGRTALQVLNTVPEKTTDSGFGFRKDPEWQSNLSDAVKQLKRYGLLRTLAQLDTTPEAFYERTI